MEMIRAGVERAKREHISLDECAAKVVTEHRAIGKRIAGLGHRVHTHDPRTPVLFALAKQHGLAGDGILFMQALAAAVAKQVKPMTINIDGALAAVLYDMGFPPPFARLIFIISRVAGLTAEVMEELTRERPMRIRIPVTYDGEGAGTSSESE
jgi:citrate synthase